jgi:hypothetical protein
MALPSNSQSCKMYTFVTILQDKTKLCDSTVQIYITYRESGREDVLQEMTKAATDARVLYSNSGDLYKHVGVLRAFDMYWGSEK